MPMLEDSIAINPQFGVRTYAEGFKGNRDQTGLQQAFATSPILSGDYNADKAAAAFEGHGTTLGGAPLEDNGANPDFKYYRRNFIPQDGASEPSDPAYQSPRDKNAVPVGTGTGLGTGYSPTIASPGEGEGTNYAGVRSVSGRLPLAVDTDAERQALNPPRYINVASDGTPDVRTVGTVTDGRGNLRRFRLGVGSAVGVDRAR